MHLQLLQDTPPVSVYFDAANDWLFADWHGDLSLAQVQAGCRTVARCFLTRTYPRVLNSNADVTDMSADVPQWLAREQLPHLGLAGVEYLAWVCGPSLRLHSLIGEALGQLRTPTVAAFDDLDDAYAWLQHTHPTHPGDLLSPRTPTQQAGIADLVAQLSQELRHHQLATGRAAH